VDEPARNRHPRRARESGDTAIDVEEHTVDGRCGFEADDPVVRAELIVLGVRDPDSVVHLTARDLLRGVRRLADAHDARDKTHRV